MGIKLSERMRNMALSWVTPYEQDGFDLIDEVAQLEEEIEELRAQIDQMVQSGKVIPVGTLPHCEGTGNYIHNPAFEKRGDDD